jgi:seryl-tRNA synthetase
MLSLQTIRERPELVKAGLASRGADLSLLEQAIALDKEWRADLANLEALRFERNETSRTMGREVARSPEILAHMRSLSDQIKALESTVEDRERRLNDQLLVLPNIPHETVPYGADASENKIVRQWGTPRTFEFTPKPHWELGESLGIMDFERGAKLSGSRFYTLRGLGARLERGLINFMLDMQTKEHGYTEVAPPFIVRREIMVGTGQLPKFEAEAYRTDDDMFLVPTAEVPLTNLHRDEILSAEALPICYTAYTPCFRREAGAAGRDTRGLKRVHQFDKVELVKFVEPETSLEELEALLGDAEAVLQRLGLAYRVVLLCTGDLGFAMNKTYDLEVWSPGVGEWLEVSSCSNAGDFQARRANIRYRPSPTARPEFVHTLNGSGLALPRIVISLMENGQQEDGSVRLPEPLIPYVGTGALS